MIKLLCINTFKENYLSNININAANLEVLLTNALDRIKALGPEELGLSKANFDYVVKLLLQMIAMVIDGIQEHEIIDLKFKAQELSALLKDSNILSVLRKISSLLKVIEKAIETMIEAIQEEFGASTLQSMSFNKMALNNLPKIPTAEVHMQQRFEPIHSFLKLRPMVPQSELIGLKLLESLETLLLAMMGIDQVQTDDMLAGTVGALDQMTTDELFYQKKKRKKALDILDDEKSERGYLA